MLTYAVGHMMYRTLRAQADRLPWGQWQVGSMYVMISVIWYHLYNFKNVENSHGGVLLSVKLQAPNY